MKTADYIRIARKNVIVTQNNNIKIEGVVVGKIEPIGRPGSIDIIGRRDGVLNGKRAKHKVTHYITQRVFWQNIAKIEVNATQNTIVDELLTAFDAKSEEGAKKAKVLV